MEYTINDFTAAKNIVIVQPGPVKEYKVKTMVPDKDKNKGKKPEEVHVMKEVEESVKTSYRVGTILSINPSDSEFLGLKAGDSITYLDRNAVKFDLLMKDNSNDECPVIITPYNIVTINKTN